MTSHLYAKLCLLLLLTARNYVSPVSLMAQTQHWLGRKEYTAGFTLARIKRYMPLLDPRLCCPNILSKRAFQGMVATAILLDGAKPRTKFWSTTKEYEKRGNYEQAVDDFYSVFPTNVNIYDFPSKGKGVSGIIGNRVIAVDRDDSSGKVTLKISQGKKLLKTIVYINKSNL